MTNRTRKSSKKKTAKKSNKDAFGNINFKSIGLNSFSKKATDIRKKFHPREKGMKVISFIERKPFTSFLAVLLIFFILMVLGNLLFSPKPEIQSTQTAPKKISIYKLGSAPQITYQGKVEKSGVAKIVAQMPGIVQSVNVSEGQQIGAGTAIVSLSSNYQGGNAPGIQAQIAQTQYNNVKDTYNQQGDLIGKQKDLANKNHDNQVLMQQITNSSVIQTQGLVNLNNSIINSLNDAIAALPPGSSNLLPLQEQLSQFQSAQNQANSSFQNLQIQANQASVDSAQEQHDVAVEQLDIQRKALDLNLEVSRLQSNLAAVNAANMYPSTPFSGTVNKIFVHVGDSVNPGTPIANISGGNQHVEIVVNVPQTTAKNISSIEPSIVTIDGKDIEIRPSFVSEDATDGVLYSIIYQLDDSLSSKLTDATYVDVRIPIGEGDTINSDPFIPLDAVVQTQEEAFVYVADNKNIARVKKVTLGNIQGKFVEVLSGLPPESKVILNRNVIEGDRVEITR